MESGGSHAEWEERESMGSGFWNPTAGGGALAVETTAAASLCSYGLTAYEIVSGSCADFSGQGRDNLRCPVVEHQSHKMQHQQYLACLDLGKRQYYGGGSAGEGEEAERKRTVPAARATVPTVPRCQVEGCNKLLAEAKDYHKRHRVCDMHSKAPGVVVSGSYQRFCQQCSRFHSLSEFDDAKRSCRRRLKGHNERRRKSSNEAIMRNSFLDDSITSTGFPYVLSSPSVRARSLLSSKATSRVSKSELSSRSSAALRELMAENRTSLFAKQMLSDRSLQSADHASNSFFCYPPHQLQMPSQFPALVQVPGNHVTLELMQVPTSVEFLPRRKKPKDDEEEDCGDLWNSLEGTQVV